MIKPGTRHIHTECGKTGIELKDLKSLFKKKKSLENQLKELEGQIHEVAHKKQFNLVDGHCYRLINTEDTGEEFYFLKTERTTMSTSGTGLFIAEGLRAVTRKDGCRLTLFCTTFPILDISPYTCVEIPMEQYLNYLDMPNWEVDRLKTVAMNVQDKGEKS